jgi:voltage-gated potassium channel
MMPPPLKKNELERQHKAFSTLKKNLILPILAFFCVYTIGVIGYFIIGKTTGGNTSLMNCFYQVGILLTGVGFTDIVESHNSIQGTVFTVSLAIFGIGFILWMLSSITAFIVSGELKGIMEQERMRKRITELNRHYILCGGGETGIHSIRELLDTKREFVLIEQNAERVESLEKLFPGLIYIIADASDDEILLDAGIENATGLISALPNDKDNLLLTISARQLNPSIRIVSRAIETTNIQKLKKAGANGVVCPNRIGGLRMTSELVRPGVTTFLDMMMNDRRNIRFEETIVESGAQLENLTLAQAAIPSFADVNIIATKDINADEFTYNPRGNTLLSAGTIVVMIGCPEETKKVREKCFNKKVN